MRIVRCLRALHLSRSARPDRSWPHWTGTCGLLSGTAYLSMPSIRPRCRSGSGKDCRHVCCRIPYAGAFSSRTWGQRLSSGPTASRALQSLTTGWATDFAEPKCSRLAQLPATDSPRASFHARHCWVGWTLSAVPILRPRAGPGALTVTAA